MIVVSSNAQGDLLDNFIEIMEDDLRRSQENSARSRETVRDFMAEINLGMGQIAQTLELQSKQIIQLDAKIREEDLVHDAGVKAVSTVMQGLTENLGTVSSELASQEELDKRGELVSLLSERIRTIATNTLMESMRQQLQNLSARSSSQAKEAGDLLEVEQQTQLTALNALRTLVQEDSRQLQVATQEIGGIESEVHRIKNPVLPAPRPLSKGEKVAISFGRLT